jgi:hypothetical protein
MTKDGRFQVSFDVIDEPLPPIDEDLICLQLPRKWFPLIQGYMGFLKARFPYDGDHAAESIDRARKFFELFDGCDVITNLRVGNNVLEAQFCGSDTWVFIGRINTLPTRYNNGKLEYDVNGDGSFSVSQYINSQQNIYGGGLPVADDNDRLCRASWIIGKAMLDDWKDIVQNTALTVNFVAQASGWLVSWLLFPPITETVKMIGTTTQIVANWLAGAAVEPEVQRKMAELLFCALKECYPDDLNNLFDYIDLGIYEPSGFFDEVAQLAVWQNFDFVAQLAYDTSNSSQIVYLALALQKIAIKVGIANMGIVVSPIQAMLTYALNTAEHFDSRDCGGFGCMLWEHQVNFETDAIILNGFPIGEAIASANQAAPWIGPNYKRQICEFRILPIETILPYGIIKVTAVVTTLEETWQATLLNYWGGPVLDEDNTHTSGDTSRILEPPEPLQGIWFYVASQIQEPNTPLQFSMTVTIQGNGTNPFE